MQKRIGHPSTSQRSRNCSTINEKKKNRVQLSGKKNLKVHDVDEDLEFSLNHRILFRPTVCFEFVHDFSGNPNNYRNKKSAKTSIFRSLNRAGIIRKQMKKEIKLSGTKYLKCLKHLLRCDNFARSGGKFEKKRKKRLTYKVFSYFLENWRKLICIIL